MPCQIANHTHKWPEEGELTIKACENVCGYCKTSSGELIAAVWTDWWLLWEHVYNIHLPRKDNSHPKAELMGPEQKYMPEYLTQVNRGEHVELRKRVRAAVVAAKGASSQRVEAVKKFEAAMVSNETESEEEDGDDPEEPRVPFGPMRYKVAKEGQAE